MNALSTAAGPRQPHNTSTSFLNTPTLFQHVQNNLLCAGRHSYFIRVLSVVSFKNAETDEGQEQLKDSIAAIVNRVNKETTVDKLTGLILIYKTHSIQMVEGSEDCVGKFMKRFAEASVEWFKETRVIMVYNNVNQVCIVGFFFASYKR